MNRDVRLDILSEYRTLLMGLASVMILCCHAESDGVSMPGWVSWLLQWGNYGVDLFLLLSGCGLYFSLRNTPSIGAWYKKRYSRILIPYAIISSIYFVYYCVVNNLGIVDYILLVSTIRFWTDHIGAWFIALLIPLYAITPLYDVLYAKIKHKGVLTIILIVLLSLLSSLDTDNAICRNIQFVVSRIPSFIIGFYLGDMIQKDKSIKTGSLLLLILGCVVLYVLSEPYDKVFQRLTLLVLPITTIATIIVNVLKESRILVLFGKISLESYLFNIYLGYVITTQYVQFANLYGYIGIVVIGTLLSVIVHKMSGLIVAKIMEA